MKDESAKHAMLVIVIACVTVLVGVVISQVGGLIGFRYLLISLCAVCGVVLATILIYSVVVERRLVRRAGGGLRRLEEIVSRLERCLETIRESTQLDAILSQDELKEKETAFARGEVWVVTQDLANDDPEEGEYFEIVQDNLKRNIKYQFFAPRTDLIQGRKRKIARALEPWRHLITWTLLDRGKFDVAAGTNVGVFLPDADPKERDEAYFEVKYRGTVRWARLERADTDSLITRLLRIAGDNQ